LAVKKAAQTLDGATDLRRNRFTAQPIYGATDLRRNRFTALNPERR
jgi:hypothetical protein